MTWGRSVLIAIDQLFNALAGGNPDETISARLGYLDYIRDTWIARPLRMLVDITFYPLDGRGHCWNAYLAATQCEDIPVLGRAKSFRPRKVAVNWKTNDIHIRGNNWALLALSIFVIAGCILILPVTWGIWICRKVF